MVQGAPATVSADAGVFDLFRLRWVIGVSDFGRFLRILLQIRLADYFGCFHVLCA